MRSDDCGLTPLQLKRVRAEAKRALDNAGANGQFPTPVEAILEMAKLKVGRENVLNESFLTKIRYKAGAALKSALSKVFGVFHAGDNLIFIDKTVHLVKQTFLKLHEVGHGFMQWQKKMYLVVEDCEKTLSPDVSDLFDREANVFASEVLFQLDHFTNEAADFDFDIKVPMNLSKKYGASIYSTIRRYVSTNHRNCVVVVLDKPVLQVGSGFSASVRRVVASESFEKIFSKEMWPELVTPDDQVGAMVPLGGRKMTGKQTLALRDMNDLLHECIAEAFTNTYQVFVLIHVQKKLTKTSAKNSEIIF